MKTVGIVTFFKANNYGVCLQAIATQRFIQKCGYEAEIIRYSNPYEHASQKLCYKENDSFLGYFTSLAKNILLGKQHYYNMGFGRITDQMVLSNESYSAKEQMEKLEYDILVAGSDQIWNPQITNGLDEVFLLQFGRAKGRISIASSIGSKPPRDEETKLFQKAFAGYSAISVREQFARDNLKGLTTHQIKVLLDPTFLFSRSEWISMLGSSSNYIDTKEKYILCYFIARDKNEYQQRVREFSEKTGLPVWTIQFSNYRWKVSSRRILGATPSDFIALFANAELVLTDSFHGTAFSINLQRNFVSFRHKSNPLRIIDLLNKLDIDERLDMSAGEYKPVNYTEVNSRLEALRQDSKQWVIDALRGSCE